MLVTALLLASSQSASLGAAVNFLASLTPAARTAASMAFDDDYRTAFRFIPAERKGAFVRDFDREARTRADRLLAAHLSQGGLRQIETIRLLEDVLLAQDKDPIRDKTLYAFTFFGPPAATGQWGWRYEGHHLSLNYTYRDGALVSSSPQFLGSSPAEVRDGPMKGTRALAEESDRAFELLGMLSDEQRRKAVIGSRTLRNSGASGQGLATNTDAIAKIEGRAGLPCGEMSASQKAALKKLVQAHADVQIEAEAKRRLAKIEKAGWETVVFAWLGSTRPGADHYYRIQGPTFVIEFDNSQDGANHIHSVWRDFAGDFGRDVLAEHYATSPHHRH